MKLVTQANWLGSIKIALTGITLAVWIDIFFPFNFFLASFTLHHFLNKDWPAALQILLFENLWLYYLQNWAAKEKK